MQNISQELETVTILDININQIMYQGLPVITLAMIDEVHERPEGTAGRNFNANRDRFIEGEDFYLIDFSKKNEFRSFDIEIPTRGLIVLTEVGYLMLVKSFSDDLAWQVQRELVMHYFTVAPPQAALPSEVLEVFQGYSKICDCIGVTGNQKAIAANQATIKHTGINALETMGLTHLIADNQRALLTVSAIVKLVGISARQLNITLIAMGLQISERDHKDCLYYEITKDGESYARSMDTGKKHSSGTPVVQIKWYSDVVELVQEYMQEKLAA